MRKNVLINSLFAEQGQQVVLPRYNADTPFYKFPSNTYRLSSPQERAEAQQNLPLDRFDFVYVIFAKDFPAPWSERLQAVWRDDSVDAILFKVMPSAKTGLVAGN